MQVHVSARKSGVRRACACACVCVRVRYSPACMCERERANARAAGAGVDLHARAQVRVQVHVRTDRGPRVRVRWDWDLGSPSRVRVQGERGYASVPLNYNKRIPMLLRALKLIPGAHCTALTGEVAAAISTRPPRRTRSNDAEYNPPRAPQCGTGQVTDIRLFLMCRAYRPERASTLH